MDDLGIYTNIRESGNKSPWDKRHKMYYADCKVCGKTVERTLYDLRHFNRVCQHGKLKDMGIEALDNMPTGFLDNEYNKRVYDLWRHMIMRTNESYWEKEPCYTGTSVSEEWKNFSNFYRDIVELDGYDLWKNGQGQRIMLDKDVKGNGSKLYSKETCCFLTHKESNQDVHRRHPEIIENLVKIAQDSGKEKGRKVKAINKNTQEVLMFDSIKECARELNLKPAHIWMCLSQEEKYKSHKSSKGWMFESI